MDFSLFLIGPTQTTTAATTTAAPTTAAPGN